MIPQKGLNAIVGRAPTKNSRNMIDRTTDFYPGSAGDEVIKPHTSIALPESSRLNSMPTKKPFRMMACFL
jgi:hypothetical protein